MITSDSIERFIDENKRQLHQSLQFLLVNYLIDPDNYDTSEIGQIL